MKGSLHVATSSGQKVLVLGFPVPGQAAYPQATVHFLCLLTSPSWALPAGDMAQLCLPLPSQLECVEASLYKPAAAAAKSCESCPTLFDPIDGSPPGSSVPRILQARTLGWVAISFSSA